MFRTIHLLFELSAYLKSIILTFFSCIRQQFLFLVIYAYGSRAFIARLKAEALSRVLFEKQPASAGLGFQP